MDNLIILFYHRASQTCKNASYTAILVEHGVRDHVRCKKVLALVIKLDCFFVLDHPGNGAWETKHSSASAASV